MSWRKTDLANVIAVLQSGSRPKGGVSTDTGEVMSLGGENILQQGGVELRDVKRVPHEFFVAMTKGHLHDRDVLINKDGANTGKVGLFCDPRDGPACINEHLFLLRGDASKITQEYLYYTLLSENGQTIIRSRISGSAQPGLKSGFINNFQINLPESTGEQEKIGEILGTLDRAIEQTEALIAKQQRIKTGLMQDLLTKGIDEHGNIRSEATHAFKDSPLGRIPVEWRVVTTGEVCKSLVPGRDKPELDGGGIPWITIPDIQEESYISASKSMLSLSPQSARAVNARLMPKDTVLMSCVGEFGIAAIATTELVANQQLHGFICRHDIVPEWLMFQIRSSGQRIDLMATQTTIKYLNKAGCESIPIVLPDEHEQLRLVGLISKIVKSSFVYKAQVNKYIKMKTGLMRDLLTGKVRVPELLAFRASQE